MKNDLLLKLWLWLVIGVAIASLIASVLHS